jgi:hypothetical protein
MEAAEMIFLRSVAGYTRMGQIRNVVMTEVFHFLFV